MTRLELQKLESALRAIGMTDENIQKVRDAFAPSPDPTGFALAIMDGWPEAYGDSLDGIDLQETAVRFGILVGRQETVPCSEYCNCLDYVDEGETVECFRVNPALKGDL